MDKVRIGVIGGSGVYQMEGLSDVEEVCVKTPFGDPSEAIVVGKLEGQSLAFLARHGRGHRIMPTELNVRANIYALKTLGVEWLISISACGSMREDYAPRHIVIPDQLFDNTKGRPATFFGRGLVVHIGLAEPFCPELSKKLYQAVKKTGATVHIGGTLLVIEGPRFSTKGESQIYRKWGVDIIGMTAVPEAQLAREAEMCYAAMAHVTDYDVWHETEEAVSVEAIIRNLLANAEIAKAAIRYIVPELKGERTCKCQNALADAIITQRDLIPQQVKEELKPIIGKYIQ